MQKLFIFLICLTAPLTRIKLNDVQLVELVIIAAMVGYAVKIVRSNFKLNLKKEYRIIYLLFFLFLLCTAYFALLSIFRPFYPPNDQLSLLKQPGWLSIFRLLQLVLMFAGSLLCLKCISLSKDNILLFFKTYGLMGTLWSVYSIISYILVITTGKDIGGTFQQGIWLRSRGMFVEGGSFGLYLVSAMGCIVVYSMVLHKTSKMFLFINIILQSVAFLLAYSKAGTCALFAVCVVLLLLGIRKKAKILWLVLLFIIVASLRLNFVIAGVKGYFSSNDTIYSRIENESNDVNLFLGRVIGMVLVPRMIKTHPFIGIGIGNYSLVRNSPDYLQGLPTTTRWDLPGLGIYGYAAEVGIPLIILLLIILLLPFKLLAKNKIHPLLISLGMYQFFAHLFGVQITFFYPWLFSSGFLAVSYQWTQSYSLNTLPKNGRINYDKSIV